MPAIKLKAPNFKFKRGFTLVEILVAVGIIGMLSGLTSVSYTQSQAKARDNKRKADLQQIKSALNLYFQQNGKYPPADPLATGSYYSYSGGAWIPDLSPTFMNTQPKDPAQAFNFLQNMLAKIIDFDLVKPVFATGGGGGPIGGGSTTSSPAVVNASVSSGQVTGTTITSSGSGYTAPPSVTIAASPDGNPADQATAYAQVSGGSVSSITISSPGAGYTASPAVAVAPPPGGPSNATGAATVSAGQVTGITITSSGSGYTAPPYVTISAPPDGNPGHQAQATAQITGGSISRLTITSPGASYTTTPVPSVVIGPPPGGAPPPPTPYPLPAPAAGCAAVSPVPYYYCYTVNSARSRFKLWTRLENTNDPQLSNNSGASCYDTSAPASLNYCLDAD